MNKNINLSQLDPNQIYQREHDQEHDAKRVIIVGQDLSGIEEGICKAVEKGLSNIKLELPKPIIEDKVEPHFNVIEVEKPVYIPQVDYKFVEIPKIVKEIEYKEVEKPVYITEYKTIEIPVIVKELEYKEVPKWIKWAIGAQSLILLGVLISHFIK